MEKVLYVTSMFGSLALAALLKHKLCMTGLGKAPLPSILKNGSGRATLDLGRGVKLETNRIERLLNCGLGALLKMIPNSSMAEKVFTNEYDAIKVDYECRYGRGNGYFASLRFVDWAKPEQLTSR